MTSVSPNTMKQITSRVPASAGAALTKGLAEELTGMKIEVKLRGANLTVVGTFRPVEDADSAHVAVEVKIKFECNKLFLILLANKYKIGLISLFGVTTN